MGVCTHLHVEGRAVDNNKRVNIFLFMVGQKTAEPAQSAESKHMKP